MPASEDRLRFFIPRRNSAIRDWRSRVCCSTAEQICRSARRFQDSTTSPTNSSNARRWATQLVFPAMTNATPGVLQTAKQSRCCGNEERLCYSKNSPTHLMKIHEYQAKTLLAAHNVPVPRGAVAQTAQEAEDAAKKIGGSVVVKAQIHAGGRGKGGGVKIAKDAAEARAIAEKMLGMTLITHQTGPEGRIVQRLLIEETLPIAHEFYL